MIGLSGLNIRLILKVIGLVLVIEGLFMLSCIPFSIYYGSSDLRAIVLSGLFTSLFGGLLWLANISSKNNAMGRKEGYVIVSLTWVVISFFGALPFIFSQSIPSLVDAYFETMSGFTTTGASVLTDIESVPKGILFWRSLTHWIGGMGIIVFSIAILPFLGIGGMQLFSAESSGPTTEKLHPRITGTAKRLWGIYLILTVVQTLFLLAGGMNLFESLCHTFGTVGTGGFSPRNDSIASYSPYIQYVLVVFMLLAGMNFSMHYFALHGKLKKVYKNQEFRQYLYTILLFVGFIVVSLIWVRGEFSEKVVRDVLFQVVSIITTTGYVTYDYLLWPSFVWVALFMLIFSGACAGSTAGGIKIVRQRLLLTNIGIEFKRLVHPSAVIQPRLDNHPVSSEVISNVMTFLLVYFFIFALSSVLLAVIGLDFMSAMGAAATTLSCVGPGIGSVGPVSNFGHLPDAAKWVLSFLMLLGRLELFTVLILFSPAFWRK